MKFCQPNNVLGNTRDLFIKSSAVISIALKPHTIAFQSMGDIIK